MVKLPDMLKKMFLQTFVLGLAGCGGVAITVGFRIFGYLLIAGACFALGQFFVEREHE